MNQLIFISSRLWKSKTHQIKFPNKFGRKGAKHSRTICVNVRVQTVRAIGVIWDSSFRVGKRRERSKQGAKIQRVGSFRGSGSQHGPG